MGERDADVVEAAEEAVLRRRVHRERLGEPDRRDLDDEPLDVDVISVAGSSSIAAQIRSTTVSGTTTGTSPFLAQLLRKMSEKLGATTASKPYCWIAHTACSRDDPTPNAGAGDHDTARRRSARR